MNDLTRILWAKSEPYKSLLTHMLEVGGVCEALLRHSCLLPVLHLISTRLGTAPGALLRTISYLCALHDIGKCHPLFQAQGKVPEVDDMIRGRRIAYPRTVGDFRHEKYSDDVVRRLLVRRWHCSRDTAENLSAVLGQHHQGKNGRSYADWPSRCAWEIMQDELEQALWEEFRPVPIEVDAGCGCVDLICTLLLGMVVLSDWIASGELFAEEAPASASEYRKAAEEKARAFLCNADLMYRHLPSFESFYGMWPEIPLQGARPVQRAVEALFDNQTGPRPLALIVEAPMGEGKTEAGLYAAMKMSELWGKDGFYIALPTAATSNAMQGRMKQLMARNGFENVRLLHSMAWLVDSAADEKRINTEEEQYARSWTMPLRRGMLSACAVGTIDQAMLSVMAIKYGVLRLLGLASKVLILDEIHAYDAYMSAIIVTLLRWCRELQVPVVMLSATLPREKKKELAAVYSNGYAAETGYPSMTCFLEDGTYRTIRIADTYIHGKVSVSLLPILHEPEKIARKALDCVSHGGCCCVLMNTVVSAQKVYTALKEISGDCEILLFHARFSVGRRDEIEKNCISLFGRDKVNRPGKAILVATQVVEQSLDLDFDVMLTEIAPIDLVFQRIGRLHRHRNTPRPQKLEAPQLYVLLPGQKGDYRGTGYIYYPIFLDRTADWLAERDMIHIPDDIQTAVDRIYSGQIEEGEMEAWCRQAFAAEQMSALAGQYALLPPGKEDFHLSCRPMLFDDQEKTSYLSAKTRGGDAAVRLAFVTNEQYNALREGAHCDRETAAAVLKSSVSVPIKSIAKGLDSGMADGAAAVWGKGLLAGTVLVPADAGVCLLADGTKWVMDHEIGFVIGKEVV